MAQPRTVPAVAAALVAGALMTLAGFSVAGGCPAAATNVQGDDGVPWPVVLMLLGAAAIFGVMGVVALGRRRS